MVVNLFKSWDRRFDYTNDTRRKWPLRFNAGDCSSVINAAYHQNDPGLYARLKGTPEAPLGERSFNIATNPNLITVARGTNARGQALDALLAKLRPGDIVCMGWDKGYYHSSGISHVEMYTGNGKCWGHGGPGKGPTEQNLSYWLYNTRVYVVKRVPPAPAPKPKPKPEPKPEQPKRKKRTMFGIYYLQGKVTHVAIVNTTSGFFHEYQTTSGSYNNGIARGLDTGSFVQVTKSHYNAFKRDCELIRNRGLVSVANLKGS